MVERAAGRSTETRFAPPGSMTAQATRALRTRRTITAPATKSNKTGASIEARTGVVLQDCCEETPP